MQKRDDYTGKTFTILFVRGGGSRLIIPQRMIVEVEKTLGFHFIDGVDAVAGESSGTITATGLVVPHPKKPGEPLWSSERLLHLTRRGLQRIFPKRKMRHAFGYIAEWIPNLPLEFVQKWKEILHESKFFDPDVLAKYLNLLYRGNRLDELLRSISIPAYLIGKDMGVFNNRNVRFVSNKVDPFFNRCGDILATDAVVSSCAAPATYASHKVTIEGMEHNFIDGGVFEQPFWVLEEARRAFPGSTIRMIVLNTGYRESHLDPVEYNKATPHKLFGIGNGMPVPINVASSYANESYIQLKKSLGHKNLAWMDVELDERFVDPSTGMLTLADTSDEMLDAMEEMAVKAIEDNPKNYERLCRILTETRDVRQGIKDSKDVIQEPSWLGRWLSKKDKANGSDTDAPAPQK